MSEEVNVDEVPVVIEPTFKRTQEVLDPQPDRSEVQWEAVRDECRSGGLMDESCNIIAAANGSGNLHVIAKKLECGCILIRTDDGVF